MIAIGLIDDHPLILTGIQSLFQDDPDICLRWAVSQPDELESQLDKALVDVVLVDINLTTANGLELCKHLRRQYPALSMIILTAYAETALIKAALRNGASGYLLKNAGHKEMSEAITTVYQGKRYLPYHIQEFLLNESLGQPSNQSPGFTPQLTRRELDVLTLIVNELTSQEIADKLFVGLKTIETHRTNLFLKFGVKNTAGLVRIAMEKGLI